MTPVILSVANVVSAVEGPLLGLSFFRDRSTTARSAYAHDDGAIVIPRIANAVKAVGGRPHNV
jgi:hypothetical protein